MERWWGRCKDVWDRVGRRQNDLIFLKEVTDIKLLVGQFLINSVDRFPKVS